MKSRHRLGVMCHWATDSWATIQTVLSTLSTLSTPPFNQVPIKLRNWVLFPLVSPVLMACSSGSTWAFINLQILMKGVVTLLQGSARSLLELKQRLQQEESRVQVRLVSGWSIQPRRPLAEGRILLLCHQPGKGRALWRCTCSRKRAERVEGGARGGYCDPHSHRMAAYARVPQKS